jgi:ligand-binding sensor domain-containing protein/serine phosphatase RsbU (regulator of sigma subunit)
LNSLSVATEKKFVALPFTTADGLSDDCVTSVFQDSKGFLWISTEDGLNRYDGQNFVSFHSDFSDDNTLSGNFILSVAEDADGYVWAGAHKKGVTLINVEKGIFKRFENRPNDASTIPTNDFSAFHLFESGDMWIKSGNYISLFNKTTNSFESYKDPFASTKDIFSSPMIGDTDSTLLFANRSNIVRFCTGSRKFKVVHNISENNLFGKVSHIARYRDGFLFGSEKGLFLFNPEKGLTCVTVSASDENKAVLSLLVDENNTVWVGTKRGLEVYDSEKNELHLFRDSISGKPLIISAVSSIEKDCSGILWLGTQYDGLIKLSVVTPHFTVFPDENSKVALNSYNFTSIYTDDDKNIWLGTMGAGLYHINIETKKVRNIVINENKHKEQGDIVFAICKTQECFWLGTNSGVYRLDAVTLNVNKAEIKGAEWADEEIHSILDDGTGGLWIGATSGLYSYNGKKAALIYRSQGGVNTILKDDENRIWVGDVNGLFRLEKNASELKYLTDSRGKNMDREVLSLNSDNRGNILAGTRAGLLRVTRDSGEFKLMWERKFSKETVTSVISDNESQIWLTVGKRINFMGDDKIIPALNAHDGYAGHTFNNGSTFRSPSGVLYFGSANGLYTINPDSLKYNPHRPKIALTGILSCQKGKCKPMYLNSDNVINIKHSFNRSVKISFAALEYTYPAQNRYRVFVENYDETWCPETRQNTILLSDLSPGHYVLKVMASNNDFIWNSEPLEIPIIVKAPVWLTDYAFAFYIILTVFVVHLIVSTRIRHYKNLNKTLTVKNAGHNILETQKAELIQANQDLRDSINYATRIQSAVIPSERKMTDIFPQSFVYFRPRDLVSGDFYWVSNIGSKVFLAAVDCTGHGVPGAFLSIIGMNLLRSIIEGKKEDNPTKILEMLSLELGKTFGNGDSEDTIKDGMDMALCVIDTDNSKMEFAGAVNELYLIRDQELITYKADRNPIGHSSNGEVVSYSTNTIDILPNDVFYIFSDGYADQFGGPEMKKFKYRRFRYLLLSIHRLSPIGQKEALNQAFEEWRGKNEQVDDILVMGFCPVKGEDF